ncbi:MAG: ATP-binding protein [Elusimicrobiota bacterium]
MELQTKLAESLSGRAEERFTDARKKLEFLTSVLVRKDLTFEQKRVMMEAYVQIHPLLQEVAVLSQTGEPLLHVFARPHENLPVDHGAALGILRQRRQGFFELRRNGRNKGQGAVEFIFYEPLLGHLSLFLRESAVDLTELIRLQRFGGTGFAYMVDSAGQVIAPSSLRKIRTDQSQSPLVATAIRNVQTLGSLHFTDPQDAQAYVGSWSPAVIAGQHYWVMVQQSQEEAYAAQRKLKIKGLLILILSASAVCLAAFLMAQWVSRPILELTEAAARISEGSFDINLEYALRNDEWGRLERTFQEMAGRLKSYSEIHLEQLLAEKTKTEATIASIADGILLLEGSRIVLANEPAGRFLAPGRIEAMIGKTLDEVIDSSRRESFFQKFAELKAGQAKVLLEFVLTPNTKYSMEMSLISVRINKGDSMATIGDLLIVRDVTLERQLQSMKDEFVLMITHDLRNPITSVRGFLEVLKESGAGAFDVKQQKAIAQIEISLGRMLILVDNVLDTYRIEQGALDLKRSQADLAEIIKTALEMFVGKAAAAEVALEFEIFPPEPDSERWKLSCDASLIERALVNLLSNALKYTPHAGRISVRLEEDGAGLKTVVSDTGDGIPEEDLDRLFKKYGQIRGRSKSGTGLGLLISKEIVEAHGGKIWVTSAPGKGSSFTFTLPKT